VIITESMKYRFQTGSKTVLEKRRKRMS